MKKYNKVPKILKNANIKSFESIHPKYERDNIRLGLSRIKKVLKRLDYPCKDIPAIQIVGTNGKGSITAFLESILFEAKKNIGVTTSPHLFDISERIRVNKKNISKNELEKIFKLINKSFSKYELTPFEKIICSALKFFDEKQVNLLILEAGLGGRLDATTAHVFRPIIAVSKIGLDHKEFLGDTIEEITMEKIAVIEKSSIVISCNQDKKLENLITERVKEVGADIIWRDLISSNYELGLKGNFQRQNASVAIGVIEALNKFGFEIKEPRHFAEEGMDDYSFEKFRGDKESFENCFELHQMSRQFKFIDKKTKVLFVRNKIPRTLLRSKIKPKASIITIGGGLYSGGTENLKRLLENLPKKLYYSESRPSSFDWNDQIIIKL